MRASALMALVYCVLLPVVWHGALGTSGLTHGLALSLGPTFAPLLGGAAKAAAVWFITFSLFQSTLQPLAGASRTLSQMAEDGLLPRALARRSRTDVPWVATLLTAGMASVFLLIGSPDVDAGRGRPDVSDRDRAPQRRRVAAAARRAAHVPALPRARTGRSPSAWRRRRCGRPRRFWAWGSSARAPCCSAWR